MNISRIVSFGAVLSSMVFAASVGGGCSSSSGTTNTGDAGTGKGSGTGSHSGSGTGTGTGHGSSSGSGTGSSTGTGTGSGAGCEIAAGTYTQHNTATVDGGAFCPAEATQTIVYPTPATDAGATDAGHPCTTTVAGCTTTTKCTFLAAGDTTSETIVQTVSSGGEVSGTVSSDTKNADGGLVSPACAYSYTWTEGTGSGSGTGTGSGSGTGTGTGSGT